MPVTAGLTIDDYEKLPDALALNHELVDGELIDVSGNVPKHNYLRDILVRLLGDLVEQQRLGRIIAEQEYDFDGNAHGPDVSFIREEKVPLLEDRRVQRFVPDLAIEIASPNDRVEDLLKKAQRYRRCGTAEVWIFTLETRTALHYCENGNLLLGENDQFAPEQIPGFSIRIGDLLDRIRFN
jgi:Uma2 family endonuclease